MAQNYCFTLNNPTLDEESELQVTRNEVSFIVYGHEKGEAGTPHLQGYLELTKRMSIGNVKKMLNSPRIHLEARKGTQEQAIQYCLKEDGEKYQRGEKKTMGRPKTVQQKNKLLQYVPEIKEKGIMEFAAHPDASFHLLKHAKEFVSLCESPRRRDTKPHVSWYWGPTGTGKTLKAFKEAESQNKEPYIKSGNGKWFDGYDGHTFVIFDDFRDSHIEFGFLLRLLDRYPMRVEQKGSSRQWKATRIIVTSPMPPSECYLTMQATDKYDKIGQLIRRIDEVVYIDKLEEDPQTPQGGLKRTIEERSGSIITPPRYLYPVNPASPILPPPLRSLEMYLLPEVPPLQVSQTQDWIGLDSTQD